MSIAYLDPGNIESDLQSGAVAKYKLLWVTFWATVVGLVMQRLSARLGVVSGKHLAEVCYEHYPKVPRLVLWIMVEIAIIGSDMQEVIGTAIALYMLSSKAIPLWAGTLITIVDTFTFLFLDKYGLRKLEFFFGVLIATMGFSFGYNYFVDIPNQAELFTGLALPWCKDCDNKALLQAVAAVGAIIMPHNLYLHSALVKTRNVDRTNRAAVSEANRYFFVESSIALLVSFVLNLFVIAVFGSHLHGTTYGQAYNACQAQPSMTTWDDTFYNPGHWNDIIDADLFKGGVFLGCTFGIACTVIWGVGILASGQSSTMTGTYAGQFAMEGFLNLKWKRWQRVLLTRTIAMGPTFSLAYFSDINHMTGVNDLMNTVMSVQLPFAVIPALTFTSHRVIMGEFVNSTVNKVMTTFFALVINVINTWFISTSIVGMLPHAWYSTVIIVAVAIPYFGFILYLTVYMLICLGFESIIHWPWIKTLYRVQPFLDNPKELATKY